MGKEGLGISHSFNLHFDPLRLLKLSKITTIAKYSLFASLTKNSFILPAVESFKVPSRLFPIRASIVFALTFPLYHRFPKAPHRISSSLRTVLIKKSYHYLWNFSSSSLKTEFNSFSK
ncbi:hypothetical protein M1O52_05480, partial [Dehalococcoidia bacterium]|nr:hypothetical protein [Dehalococcoidia bacterium]